MLADLEMKAAILGAERVPLDDPVFKTIDGRTLHMLRAMTSFVPASRPSAEQVLRYAYIAQRKTLSKKPIPGHPAKMAQVGFTACYANHGALVQKSWQHFPAGNLLSSDEIFATVSGRLTLWPACFAIFWQ